MNAQMIGKQNFTEGGMVVWEVVSSYWQKVGTCTSAMIIKG